MALPENLQAQGHEAASSILSPLEGEGVGPSFTWGAVNSACVTLTPVRHPTAPTFPELTLITSGALHHVRGAFYPVRLTAAWGLRASKGLPSLCCGGASLASPSSGALLSLSASSEDLDPLRPKLGTGPGKVDRELPVDTSDSLRSIKEVGLRPHCKPGSQDPEAARSGALRLWA